jgi:predicted helicase
VKFIAFAQKKMDAIPEGVVGIITNHSWLDNPTFKGMRKSLMATFNQIYVLDLHGNTKKKERAPEGEDQNVFDIEQGVAISLLIKGGDLERGVCHSDLWGKRLAKYQAAALGSISSVTWTRLEPDVPDWLFKPRDAGLGRRYREFWSIPAIFAPLGDPAPGFATQHDDFAISYSPTEAIAKVRRFLNFKSEREARQDFSLCAQKQWQYERAKKELAELNLETHVQVVAYRPFDDRWTLWDRNVAVHRRLRVTKHLLFDNLALIVAKNWGAIGSETYDGAAVAAKPVELNYFRRGGEFVFPIYILNDDDSSTNRVGTESLAPSFRAFLDSRYEHHYTPEEILGYIYAVLHAPTYRTRYAAFLRIDFPRVPFPEAADDFETLSGLGWALVQAHLLRELPRRGLAVYHGKGDHRVEIVRYSPQEQAIHINKTQNFKPVPQAVWEFHIGGYQVLDKYLKSRKGRVLSLDEINHIGAVADSLAFTLD